jgi:predicted TIM-barrel fold metal-dependent hydrolase
MLSFPRSLQFSRRRFLAQSAFAALAFAGCKSTPRLDPADERIIDIHQHTHYHGRSNRDLIRHQRAMGATTTVLLPAGLYFGLDAQCGGNDTCLDLAQKYPETFRFFANEMPFLPSASIVIEKFLKLGAIGIGEQKFRVASDSIHIERIARIAEAHDVPVLLHFKDTDYNIDFSRFHKILEKFPKVRFIGHAQTWWGNISQDHDPRTMYPKGPVKRGGITDRLLSDYPNIFGDLSAGSGLNALLRDPEHTRGFLDRHQDKLLFGSDCEDVFGKGEKCTGSQILKAVRQYAPDRTAVRKMVFENARRVLRL